MRFANINTAEIENERSDYLRVSRLAVQLKWLDRNFV